MDSMHRLLHRAAAIAVIAGTLTFISLGAIIAVSGGIVKPATYPNEQGFTQAIFWFEMADSGEDVIAALGDPATEAGRSIRAAMDATHRIDFIFMVCYSAFSAALFLLIYQLSKGAGTPLPRGIFPAGVIFCCTALLGDILETTKLLELSALTDPMAIDAAVPSLMVWTRVKSGSLSTVGILLAYSYARYFKFRLPGALIPLLFGTGAIVGAVAISFRGVRFIIEQAGILGMLAWLMALVHAASIWRSAGRSS